MKIAHVSHEYHPTISGVGQVVRELAERQVQAGHDVYVVTSDWDKYKRIPQKEETLNGVHIIRCRHIVRMGNFASISPSMFFVLMKNKFDIVHSHVFGHVHFVLAAASTMSGARHVHTTHCPWSDAYRSVPARLGLLLSYNLISRYAMNFTDKIIAITPWEFDYIKKYGGKEKQIVNLPNGMSDAFFRKVKNNDFKKQHGIKGKLVLFFGRLNVLKGPDRFVDIAKLILKEKNDVTFVVRGPDEGMKSIVKEKIGSEKRIILMEPTRDRKEIVAMYQAADVFVLPSYREGLPLTLFEAMASSLPIVASPVNGVPYEMKEPDNGFLVPYTDLHGFKQRIIELLDNQALRDTIGKNNQARSKNYRWDTIAAKTLALYDSLIV